MSTFGARDLALLLPDKVGDILSLRHTEAEIDNFEPLKPKLDQSKKVTRYFPGKAPTWVEDENTDNYLSKKPVDETSSDSRLARLAKATAVKPTEEGYSRRRRVYEAEIIVEEGPDEESSDNNFRNFVEAGKSEHDADAVEGDIPFVDRILRSHRHEISEDKIGHAPHGEGNENDEEYEIQARRARVLARLAERKKEVNVDVEDLRVTARKEEEEESEADSSEYETDSEEDDEEVIFKPVFVPRARRETIKERETLEAEETLKEQKKMLESEERKRQTRTLLAESIRRTEEKEMEVTDMDSDAGLPDDTDDLDDESEFDNWKIREMARLKRDAEAREVAALEKADLERRRNLTDKDRMEEDRKLGRFDEKPKEKWRFLQKYYHKGVFYMDEDSVRDGDVRTKDFSAPTLEDKFNKEALPQVLQVKNFGKKGRTKYTHLLDQDTSTGNNRVKVDDRVKEKYMAKRGGVGDLDVAGRLKRKKLDS